MRPAARAIEDPARRRTASASVLILLKVITIFSPLRIFLPISAAAFVRRRGVRRLDDPDAVARHELVGAADPAERRHLSRRPRVRADLVAALRGPRRMTRCVDRSPALVIVPTYNERENLPVLVDGADAASERPGARRRRSIAGRHRRGGRRARARAPGAGRGHAPHRRRADWDARTSTASRGAFSEPVDVICQMDADLSHDPRHLPALIAAAGACGRRDRLAVCAGRRDRQLAAAPAAAQPLRQHLHPADHAAERARLHERLPLLAARGARRHAARSLHLRRLLVSGRDAVRRRRAGLRGSPKCRSPSSSGGRANRSCRARCCSSRRSRRGGWSRADVRRDDRP